MTAQVIQLYGQLIFDAAVLLALVYILATLNAQGRQ